MTEAGAGALLQAFADPQQRSDAAEALARALGARRVQELDKGPAGHWWLMQDPEGNEFCAAA